MKIGVPKEIHEGERRVATTPDVVTQLRKLGFDVAVEAGAGAAANYSDEAYEAAGCEIVASRKDLWKNSDIILKVRAPDAKESQLAAVRPDTDQLPLAGAESGHAEGPHRVAA